MYSIPHQNDSDISGNRSAGAAWVSSKYFWLPGSRNCKWKIESWRKDRLHERAMRLCAGPEHSLAPCKGPATIDRLPAHTHEGRCSGAFWLPRQKSPFCWDGPLSLSLPHSDLFTKDALLLVSDTGVDPPPSQTSITWLEPGWKKY